MNIEKDATVADNVVRDVMHIVERYIVADVTRYNGAVGNTTRHLQIVELKHHVFDGSDTHHAIKTIVFHQVGVEIISHQNVVPTCGGVAVFHQALNLVGTQMTPAVFGPLSLLISEIVFVETFFEILFVDEVLVNTIVW